MADRRGGSFNEESEKCCLIRHYAKLVKLLAKIDPEFACRDGLWFTFFSYGPQLVKLSSETVLLYLPSALDQS